MVRLAFSLFALVAAAGLRADVRLPALIGDHMVVQRDLPVHIWGQAEPGEPVSVTFRGATRTAKADDAGFWDVYLPAGSAGGPFDLTVAGRNTITVRDVLAGDVWVASGQSNMEWPVKNSADAEREIATAKFPRIRLFTVERNVSSFPLEDVESKGWAGTDPGTVADFSAVAYFFGRDLHERTGVPVGLIDASWGGTPADAWISLRGLSADASLMPVFAEWSRMNDGHVRNDLRRRKEIAAWEKASERAKAAGTKAPGFPWAPNERGSWAPAALYNAMIAPLTKAAIRGAIWYQGESNTSPERRGLYARLFEAMIRDWRRAWGQGDFPFLFTQLANWKSGPDSGWPAVREAQRDTLSLANTGMAVTIDIGDPGDIHPRNKQDVGKRLALWARAISYGEKLVPSGPLFRQATPEGRFMRVWFEHSGSGLKSAGGELLGFEIAGPDGKWFPADARIDGATVTVSSHVVEAPTAVRYAWSDNPSASLFNAEGLPASPFTSVD